MGKMNDYSIWLEEKGYLVWDESREELVWPPSSVDADQALYEYMEEQRKAKEKKA